MSGVGLITVGVKFSGKHHDIGTTAGQPLNEFRQAVEAATGVRPDLQKLTYKAKILRFADETSVTVGSAGLVDKAKLMLIASPESEIDKVREFTPAAPPPKKPKAPVSRLAGAGRGAGEDAEHYFDEIKVLSGFSTPPPDEARKLLVRLATDRGIKAIMRQHKWRVGRLSEMPPVGKVGVDEVCVLGLNKNQGQEILLRLRTDDCRGFRHWNTIYATLLHELSHNVHSNHGPEFHKLNRQLEKEAVALDWTRSGGSAVGGSADRVDGSNDFYDPAFDDPAERPAADVMREAAASSGRALGGNVLLPILCDPRELAASAAEMRLTAKEQRMKADCESAGGRKEDIEAALNTHHGTVHKIDEDPMDDAP